MSTRRREVYGTEKSWCRAVAGGTGVTVVSLLLKSPGDLSVLVKALHKLQSEHPILRAKLQTHPNQTFSLLIPPTSCLSVNSHDPHSTSQIILGHHDGNLAPFQIILEHEMNLNPWEDPNSTEVDVMHASAYEFEKWMVVIKLHTGACDRTAAVQVMRELMDMIKVNIEESESESESEQVVLGVEEYVPSDKTGKPFWARGVDMLGYSLNSFRLSNIHFADPTSQRSSRVVRLSLDSHHTSLLLEVFFLSFFIFIFIFILYCLTMQLLGFFLLPNHHFPCFVAFDALILWNYKN